MRYPASAEYRHAVLKLRNGRRGKAYPLRISAAVLDAMRRWLDDELRSVNAQIEYVLREAVPARPVADDNEVD